jgi:hypothetical protein
MEEFSKRKIVVFALGLLLAGALTVAGTYEIINRFVINHDDPLTRAGGIAPDQKAK